MPKILKRCDKTEEYNKTIIIDTMIDAGITKVTFEDVPESIHYREGMATAEIRNRVISGNKNREPQTDRQFEWHPRKTHNA